MTVVCSVEGCERVASKRGWCGRHYKRWWRHGNASEDKRAARRDPAERFWPKINKDGPVPDHRPDLGPCWLWTAAQDGNGYGHFGLGGKYGRTIKAYRFAYELLVGPVPDGMELDHLCRVTICVNPAHLEAVTHKENMLRGDTIGARHAARTHCPRGHPYSPENTTVSGGKRYCRRCNRESKQRRLARERSQP